MTDFRINDQGSVVGFTPVSQSAKEWFDENVQSEGWQWMGNTLYADHRMAQGLIEGIEAEGFEVSS